jgi:hypothetical protein
MKFITQKWVLKHIGALLLCVLSMGFTSAQQNNNWILFPSGLKISWQQNGLTIDSVFPRKLISSGHFSKYAAVSNDFGNLLFYSGAQTIWTNKYDIIRNAPDSPQIALYDFGVPQNSLILPIPSDTSLFKSYLAQEASNSLYIPAYLKAFWVSPYHVNLWQPDTGKVLVVDSLFYAGDNGDSTSTSLMAVKHGNGRDYWLVYHPTLTDTFLTWLQDENGNLTGPFYQKIGPFHFYQGLEWMRLSFNNEGTKMALMMWFNIWIYDFDRCTGKLSNPVVIDTCTNCWNEYAVDFTYPSGPYFEGCFSPNGKMYYATRMDSLIQFDLTDFPNSINRTVVWYSPANIFDPNAWLIRGIALGPDRKIYVGTHSNAQDYNQWAPIDSGCSYLGVIEYPNVAGMGCSFNRLGLYLNGYLSCYMLPTVVDYDMGPLIGSPCDTLITTSISELNPTPQITLAPNPAQTQATLTWSGVREGTFVLRDMLGRAVLSEQLNAPNGTTRLDLSALPKGIYLWQVQSDGYSKNEKLVVE